MVIVKNIENKIVKRIAFILIFIISGAVTAGSAILTIELFDQLAFIISSGIGSVVGMFLYAIYVVIFNE